MNLNHDECGHTNALEKLQCAVLYEAERLMPYLYKAACEEPGLGTAALGRKAGTGNASVASQAVKMAEEEGLIYRKRGRGQLKLCYPVALGLIPIPEDTPVPVDKKPSVKVIPAPSKQVRPLKVRDPRPPVSPPTPEMLEYAKARRKRAAHAKRIAVALNDQQRQSRPL